MPLRDNMGSANFSPGLKVTRSNTYYLSLCIPEAGGG